MTPWSSGEPVPQVVDAPGDGVPEVSVVIPVHNEAENVEPLYESLRRALEELGRTYEIVVVDDGSRDNTYPRLTRLAADDPNLRLVELRSSSISSSPPPPLTSGGRSSRAGSWRPGSRTSTSRTATARPGAAADSFP
jgi:glycosyltransferase involved in cell wall biosynthesis